MVEENITLNEDDLNDERRIEDSKDHQNRDQRLRELSACADHFHQLYRDAPGLPCQWNDALDHLIDSVGVFVRECDPRRVDLLGFENFPDFDPFYEPEDDLAEGLPPVEAFLK